MSDTRNRHDLGSVIYDVYDAPIADANSPVIFEGFEFLAACRPGVFGKRQNSQVYSREEWVSERIQFFLGGVFNVQRIVSHGGVNVSGE
jgi:hypothetical protein